MSPSPYPNLGWGEAVSTAISRSFPRWTVTISRTISGLLKSLWYFLVELFHDAIGR